jgi:8-oxo-dGTP pyrophosphatase MutT (NUDIX family)
MTYSGAGVLFTNRSLALAGYHPHKGCLSGLGGKREHSDQCSQETAFRELLEELLGVATVPPSLMTDLCSAFSCPELMICDSHYVLFVYSFKDLVRLLHLCKSSGITSPLYTSFPESIEALLLERLPHDGEISDLALVPVRSGMVLDPCFQEDLEKLMER